ncbi:MAG: hypothetical protein ABI954_06850 [Pyrinomonadaceae bacterium]
MQPMTLFLIICALSLPCLAQENNKSPDLKFIKLFHTTRTEVERVFGKSEDSNDKHEGFYKSKEFNLLITYSYGKCTDKDNSGWNIPRETVTHLNVHFGMKPVLFSSLNLDRSKFQSGRAYHQGFFLENVAEGISLSIAEDETQVYSISYFPNKNSTPLKCPNTGEPKEKELYPCDLTIDISSSEFNKKQMIFVADVTSSPLPRETQFKWQVSKGEIISGQGTTAITVEPNSSKTKEVTATFTVESPNVCRSQDSLTVKTTQ